MASFVLEIKVGNAGMTTVDDLAQALLEVSQKIPVMGLLEATIRDVNGNRVGSYGIRGD